MSYTIIIIKNDAIERGLTDRILEDVGKVLQIVQAKHIKLTNSMVMELKGYEWTHKWNPPPCEFIKQLSILYEAQQVNALLCKSLGSQSAIEIGRRLKGESHIAHLCSKDTIRGKYYDSSIVPYIRTDQNGFSFLVDDNEIAITYPPNIIHSVSDIEEFESHIKILFPEFYNVFISV